MASTFSFESLCEDLQAEVCACIASSRDADGIHRLHLISKTVQRLCEEPYVLSRASLKTIPWNPWYTDPDFYVKHGDFLRRCFDAGNPEAIYRFGVVQYFSSKSNDQQQAQGLQLIADAAEKGVEEAIQLYGLIQICLGCEDKGKVYKRLSAFTIPLTPSKVREVEARWDNLRSSLNWIGAPKMKFLKQRYIREDCKCNGLTSQWFAERWPGWERFQCFEGMATSMACDHCMWHEVLRFFFKYV